MTLSIGTHCFPPALTALLVCTAALQPCVRAAAEAQPPARTPAGSAAPAAELATLRRRIAALTSQRERDLEQREADSAALRAAELAIAAGRRRFDDLQIQSAAAQRRRSELRIEAGRVQSELDKERAALAQDLRNAYVMHADMGFDWLRGQTDAAEVGRMSTYAGYFTRRRVAAIEIIRGRAAAIGSLTGEIGLLTSRLQMLKNATARELDGLTQARDARAASLAAIETRLTGGAGELNELRRRAEAEESLLADLARVVPGLPDAPTDGRRNFAGLHGRLAWPVDGRIVPGAALRWNGILIEAARGARIRAPCAGRVVYADWLQGLGLLLIIAHDDSFMTLYGHAEVLYKSVGDEVAAGEVIGALSDAGAPPQLYFEIREGRSPQDPRGWLEPLR